MDKKLGRSEVPTTFVGRIDSMLIGVQGVLLTSMVTAAFVHAVQDAARRAGPQDDAWVLCGRGKFNIGENEKPLQLHENQQPTRNTLPLPTRAQQVVSIAARSMALTMNARIA